MATEDKNPIVTLQELLVACLPTADALVKFLVEKQVITEKEFMEKLSEERAANQALLRAMKS